MRLFIHGIKSLIRRPAKTIMLLLILFVVFNLIFVGFIIRNSVSQSKEYIRSQIGGAVEYRVDMTSLISSAAGNPRNAMQSVPALSQKVADKIAKSSYVSQYFVSETASVNATAIKPAQTQSDTGGFQGNFSDFTMKGSNVPEGIDFVTGSITLKDGSFPSSANVDNGDPVILISQAVATANNLRINDKVTLGYVKRTQQAPVAGNAGGGIAGGNNGGNNRQQTTSTTKSETYNIIGIYDTKSTTYNVNTVLTSNKAILSLSSRAASDNTNASIVFMLKNPADVDAFVAENKPFLTSQYHTLYSNDAEYNSLTRPLNLIAVITSLLISVVFAAGAAIILAIVTIFVRDRKFEIGLLLSSGEGRFKIVMQFVFEMTMIAIIAFLLSAVSSNLIAKSVGNWIANEQLLSTQSVLVDSTTTTTSAPAQFIQQRGPGGRNNQANVYGSVNMKDVAAEFDASISSKVFGQLLLSSLLLVLIGSGVPLVVIMGYNPRRILQDY